MRHYEKYALNPNDYKYLKIQCQSEKYAYFDTACTSQNLNPIHHITYFYYKPHSQESLRHLVTKLSKLQNILLHIEEIRNFLFLIRRCFYYHLFFSFFLLFLSCILFSFNAHHINLVLNLLLFIMNYITKYENHFYENSSPTHRFFTVI